MANRDQRWLYIALMITVGIHLSAVSPLSQMFDRMLMPLLTDENIIIELSEILPKKNKEQIEDFPKPLIKKQKKIPELPKNLPTIKPPSKKTIPIDDPIPFVDPTKRELSEDLKEDRIPNKENSKSELRQLLSSESQKEITAAQGEKRNLDLKQSDKGQSAAIQSPLVLPQEEGTNKSPQPKHGVSQIPKEVKQMFRGDAPEKTNEENLEYSMNSYKWSFERFMENWAFDLQKWWKAPMDYAYGNVPEGGDIWIQVKLSRSGRLVGYQIFDSKVTSEMELRVVQALIGSLKRPKLPAMFLENELIVNWRFVYPPIRPAIQLRR